MDSVSSPELAEIFDRTSQKVDFKGAYDAGDIDAKMEYKVDLYRARAHIVKTKQRRKKLRYLADQLDRLIEHGASERWIAMAVRNPKGFISQTLLHGRAEAKRRVLAYRRQRIAAYQRVGVRPEVPRFAPVPETRRMRWRT
jgi:hypothetical protein